MRCLAAAFLLAGLAHAPGSSPDIARNTIQMGSVPELIVRAATAAGVPPELALAIAWRESGFDARRIHTNAHGYGRDYGVFQLNSFTVRVLGVADPLDARQNIAAGVALLAEYLFKYRGDQARTDCAFAFGPAGC